MEINVDTTEVQKFYLQKKWIYETTKDMDCYLLLLFEATLLVSVKVYLLHNNLFNILGNKKMDALKSGESGSRRGSLVPPPPRSRQGSVVIGGAERRGSYYDDGVTTRYQWSLIISIQ